jgi:tRNA (cytidine/uridine-2'-O-)-methyltransferase
LAARSPDQATFEGFKLDMSFSASELTGNSPQHGVPPRLHVVLFQPEIAPNTGAIGRTCVALGAKLWLVRPLGFRIDEKRLRRAGLDYWQHLHWEIVDHWEHLQSTLQPNRWWYFSKKATQSFRAVQYQTGDALVFGCETSGLPESITSANPERLLRIPTSEHVRSLNLSCSVAVAGFEAARQWE